MTATVPNLTRATLSAEWTKLRTVRSTWFTLVSAAIVTIAVGIIAAAEAKAAPAGWTASGVIEASLGGLLIAQLAFGVLGALAVTPEYTTGMMRTTFAAVPQRRAVLAAKATVIGAVSLVAGQAIAFGAYLGGQLVTGRQPGMRLGDPGVLRAVSGAGFYLFLLTMIGLGLGVIIRHTAGTLAAIGLILIEPLLARYVLPDASPLGNYVLWWAGQAIMSPATRPNYAPPSQALLVCVAYALIVLIPATVLVGRRDA